MYFKENETPPGHAHKNFNLNLYIHVCMYGIKSTLKYTTLVKLKVMEDFRRTPIVMISEKMLLHQRKYFYTTYRGCKLRGCKLRGKTDFNSCLMRHHLLKNWKIERKNALYHKCYKDFSTACLDETACRECCRSGGLGLMLLLPTTRCATLENSLPFRVSSNLILTLTSTLYFCSSSSGQEQYALEEDFSGSSFGSLDASIAQL